MLMAGLGLSDQAVVELWYLGGAGSMKEVGKPFLLLCCGRVCAKLLLFHP